MASLENHLKQRCIDESGLYEWVIKSFRLNTNLNTLEVSENGQITTILSLDGVKYAKEWSVSSTIAGFGFDIVWSTGKIFSFLADDEASCLDWVRGINNSIALKSAHPSESESDYETPGYNKKKVLKFIDDDMKTEKRTVDFGDAKTPAKAVMTPDCAVSELEVTNIANALDREAVHEGVAREDIFASLIDVSNIPKAGSGSGSADSSHSSSTNSPHEKSRASDKADIRPAHESRSLSNVDTQLNTLQSHISVQSLDELSTRNSHLLSIVERQRLDKSNIQDELEKIKDDAADRISFLERELQQNREKTKHLQVSLREAEAAALRDAAEARSLHAAEKRVTAEQYRREAECLRDELSAERKRYAALLQEERNLRLGSESREVELKQCVQDLDEQLQCLRRDYANISDQMFSKVKGLESELLQREDEAERRVSELIQEKDAVAGRAQSDMRIKMAELSDKYQTSIRDMERTVAETMRQEVEGQRLRDIVEIQKKCTRDIETARTEGKKLASIELEKLREAFLDRERQAQDDLIQLEKLHAERVGKLSEQLAASRDKCNALQDDVRVQRLENAKLSDSFKEFEMEMHDKMGMNARQADALKRDVMRAVKELEEAQAREVSYREHLVKALEEARIATAEKLEAKRQLSSGSAQAHQWRRAAHESGVSQTATATALEIAQDEISMLEHELRRVKGENQSLRSALERADKIVYGNRMPPRTTTADINGAYTSQVDSGTSKSAVQKKVSPRSELITPSRGKGTMMTQKSRLSAAPVRDNQSPRSVAFNSSLSSPFPSADVTKFVGEYNGNVQW